MRDGEYKVVVMNADGSRGVEADGHFEFGAQYLSTIALASMLAGLMTLGGGIALFLAGTVAAMARSSGDWMPVRIGFIVALLALSPLLAAALPLVSVGVVAGVVLILAGVDSVMARPRVAG